MEIKRFRAEGVHGYLNPDVSFQRDLTFLTGINGSGKTSVIYSIVALISPDLSILANLDYKKMSLTLAHNGDTKELVAVKKERTVDISIEGSGANLRYPIFEPDPDEPSYKTGEREADFYKQIFASESENEVLKVIATLPTPMFLNLDRRSRMNPDRRVPGRFFYNRRRGRNVFSASLANSLHAATELAEHRYYALQARLHSIGEKSRRDMVLSLLSTETTQRNFRLHIPTAKDAESLQQIRSAADRLPALLQLSREDIDRHLNPLLDLLQDAIDKIPRKSRISAIFEEGQESEAFKALVAWSASRQQLDKIQKMFGFVRDYRKSEEEVSEEVNRYTSLVNRFLRDSGKLIVFDKEGSLQVSIEGLDGLRPISSLSSGEIQIVVIITHLFFNPAAQEANVFIVDEPELSLHVQWQELFVDSVLEANPNIQYIMATHSPSIILERTINCTSISGGVAN